MEWKSRIFIKINQSSLNNREKDRRKLLSESAKMKGHSVKQIPQLQI